MNLTTMKVNNTMHLECKINWGKQFGTLRPLSQLRESASLDVGAMQMRITSRVANCGTLFLSRFLATISSDIIENVSAPAIFFIYA